MANLLNNFSLVHKNPLCKIFFDLTFKKILTALKN